ncbi:EAL domain-containing protein [Oryzibacter oryziterrae]|uniref:EAL domain-containing protein n=1 Tax=Oryzibacter oryziterrae TaxID=2766474 RepID=UPI001F296798|nr:EAL domain-containing protein [Oryzibacter oryziterrae]
MAGSDLSPGKSKGTKLRLGKPSLQVVVLIIVGAMLLTMQFAAEFVEALQQRNDIESLSSKRAYAAIDMLTALQTEAMVNRVDLGADDPAIQTLNGAMARMSASNNGIRIWVVMGPKVKAYQRENHHSLIKNEVDDVDRSAIASGETVKEIKDGVLRISVPIVLGRGPAADVRCSGCHTAQMGIENGELIGLYSVAVDMSSEYAMWQARFWRMLELALMSSLITLVITVWMLRRMVVSPLEKLTAITRRLAREEEVAVPTSGATVAEIGELSDAMVVFRNNLERKRELEAQNALAVLKLEHATESLDTALRTMTQGLCMFDKDHNLVLLNERFLEIFGLPETAVNRRTTFSGLCHLIGFDNPDGKQYKSAEDCASIATRHLQALTSSDEPVIFEEQFGERILAITHAGTGEGGWVTTIEDISVRRQHEARIAYLARYDTLTGLPNRVLFHDHLQMETEWARRNGVRVGAIGIDINQFKEINDQRGHAVGDAVLNEIGRRLSAVLGEGEFVARIGADEFSATKRFVGDTELGEFLTRIERCFAAIIHYGDSEVQVSGSIGVAIFPEDATDPEQLVNNADLAMYRAKRSVNQSICFYEATMDEAARERRALAHDLWEALAKDQFHMTYQVQKLVQTQETTGYEALLRWTHPQRGPISPEIFIPVAEECGAIIQIGQWVLRRACLDAMSWNGKYRVAVNLSPVQMANDDVVAFVRQVLYETGLPPSRLELEITESTIIDDKLHALHVLRQLKALGVTVALDDFGTGYSSLDTLNSFPFDKIKIDRSFLMAADHKPESRAIVKAVLALGRSLSVPVLAEGVETESQLRLLQQEGCLEAQGFYFGRPMVGVEGSAPAQMQIGRG